MAIKFPKKQEQRLIPKYLLDYLEEVNELHPDPSDLGGGDNIEAGTGIEITGDEIKTISVDDETVAMVANLAPVAFSGDYDNLINKPTNIVTTDTDQTITGKKTFTDRATFTGIAGAVVESTTENKNTSYRSNSIMYTGNGPYKIWFGFNENDYIFPQTKGGEVAVTSEIITSYNDLTNKPDLSVYELAADAFSGDYNDLTNKPSIPTATSDLTNDSGFITGIDSSDVISALGYTPGTSNFSGDYNDLTNKPAIPTKTSDLTNDSGFITNASLTNCVKYVNTSGSVLIEAGNWYGTGANITGLTNVNMLSGTRNTFALPGDKSGTIALTSDIPSTTNYVTTDTAQTITARKTIVGASEGLYIQSGPNWTSSDTMILPGQIMTNRISGTKVSAGELVFTDSTTQQNSQIRVRDFTQNPFVDYRIEVPTKNGTMALTSDIPTNVSAFTNDSGYITGITSSDVTTALGYTPGTSNFSGSYNDLTDKPTIPTATSDLTNDSGFITSSDLPTNHVTTNTTQTITGIKTFSGTGNLIKMKNTGNYGNGIMFLDKSDKNIGFFEFRTDDKVLKFGVNTAQGPGYKVGFQSYGNRTYTAYLPDNADKYSAIGAGDVYLPLSVNGNKASVGGDITLSATSTVTPSTTQLVFTYTDNTTETITLMTGASVTTTLS